MSPSGGIRIARGLTAALLAVGLLVGTAGSASADTRSKISVQQKRLVWLEGLISKQQSKVLATQASLRALAGKVGATRREYEALQMQVAHRQTTITKLRARFHSLRMQIGSATAEVYMQGPFSMVEGVFESRSLSEAADVVQYANSVVARDLSLGEEIRHVAAQLKVRQTQDKALIVRRAAALSRLKSQRDALAQSFASEQVRIEKLAQTRAVVGTLLGQLRKQLRAEEIAAAEASLAQGTPLSFGKWATAFLDAAGAPVSRNNLIVLVAWQTAEYTVARWNPLATTKSMPGATRFNSAGVKNYSSLAEGIRATVLTLAAHGYRYEGIVAALKRSASPMDTARAINASSWCAGCANGRYVIELVPAVSRSYSRTKR